MQEGQYVARLIKKRLKGETLPAFRYTDYGSLAVIGRNAAVVDLGFVKFAGFPAWLAWIFVHIFFLIEFDNKLIVMIQWAWNYFTRKRGARLITNQEVPQPMGVEDKSDYRTPVKV
jgi:NADH dehydrogenase